MDTAKAKKLRFPPALALFLLAPTIGELLSGSAPPTEFFSPAIAFMLLFIYSARKLRADWGQTGQGALPKPIVFWIVATLAGFAFSSQTDRK